MTKLKQRTADMCSLNALMMKTLNHNPTYRSTATETLAYECFNDMRQLSFKKQTAKLTDTKFIKNRK